jgi:ribonuclease PH
MNIVAGVNPYAEGSVEVSCGRTKLLISLSVERDVPPWMKGAPGGWITAEYGMLPRATHTRNKREAAQGKQSGRTLEIQRLIGRALRASLDLNQLPGLTLRLDCDVLCADGGTRTAAISGAWVALAQAVRWAKTSALLSEDFQLRQVAAISAGIVGGRALLDLCYDEDSTADFDMNLVLDADERIIEIQGTSERENISLEKLRELTALATDGIRRIMQIQRRAAENF